MAEGFILLHRKLIENAIFYKPNYFQVWVYILLKVNHKDNEFIWNNEKKICKKGSGIFSQLRISKDLGISLGSVSNILKYLKSENQIEIKSSNKFTEIQVVKWDDYQSIESIVENRMKTKRKQRETNKHEEHEEQINYMEIFDSFRKNYPGTKQGLETEFKRLVKHSDYKLIIPFLNETLSLQKKNRDAKKLSGGFVPPWKNLGTWINQRCWEEEMAKDETPAKAQKTFTSEDPNKEYFELYS